VADVNNLRQRGKQARSLIHTPFPKEVTDAIINAYQELCDRYGSDTDVAVRSSATEDLPMPVLPVSRKPTSTLTASREYWKPVIDASPPYLPTAISYRQSRGYDHFSVALRRRPKMALRFSLLWVMFSIDTETGFKNAALITAAYGLGKTWFKEPSTPMNTCFLSPP